MAEIHVLTANALRDAVGLGAEELAAVEAVYPLISARAGSMPPIVRIDVPEHRGEVDIKAAYLPGYAGIAVKVSAGFFDNPARGLPSLGGLMIVLDAETGVPRAALFDGGYLTDLRTALAGAVAADHLAVEDASEVAVVGAGLQARLQLEALTLVRPIRTARVWARSPERAEAFATRASEDLRLDVRVAASVAEAVMGPSAGGGAGPDQGVGGGAGADILVTTTPSTEPLVGLDALRPGLHLTAVGSDAEHKRELTTAVLDAADLVVCDHREQSLRLGELRGAVAEGFDPARVVELGEVVAAHASSRRPAQTPGRVSAEAITVCDLTGTGAQDTAIASLALARCLARGAGTRVEL